VKDREKYLARQRRYNQSVKGSRRYGKYEAKHPERRARWSAIMEIKARDR
jgi:hypothetical protein